MRIKKGKDHVGLVLVGPGGSCVILVALSGAGGAVMKKGDEVLKI